MKTTDDIPLEILFFETLDIAWDCRKHKIEERKSKDELIIFYKILNCDVFNPTGARHVHNGRHLG